MGAAFHAAPIFVFPYPLRSDNLKNDNMHDNLNLLSLSPILIEALSANNIMISSTAGKTRYLDNYSNLMRTVFYPHC